MKQVKAVGGSFDAPQTRARRRESRIRCDTVSQKQLLRNFHRSSLCAFLFLVCLSVLQAPPASATASIPRLSQYGHTVWRTQDGLFSTPNSIAQTTDGYLWIGTDAGLIRFDGARFVPWNTFPDGSIATWGIDRVLATTDGSLWIGSNRHVAQVKDKRIVRYDIPGRAVDLVEDEAGIVWFVQTRSGGHGGPLCSVSKRGVTCYRAPEIPLPDAAVVTKSVDGGLWFAGSQGLCRWSPGRTADCYLQQALKPLNGLIGVNALLTAGDGTLWVGIARAGRELGLGKLVDGKWESFAAAGLDGSSLPVTSLLEDRDHSLWVGTQDQGLYRIRDGLTEHFGLAEGLSGATVSDFYEDREGIVWVSTTAGVDAFRRLPVSVFSSREGLPGDGVDAVLPTRDGTVWIGGITLTRLVDDQVLPPPSPALFRERAVTSMLEDHGGRLWIGLNRTLNVFENGTLKPIASADGGDLGPIEYMVEDNRHDVWVVKTASPRQMFRIRDLVVTEPLDADRLKDIVALAADSTDGFWIGYRNGAYAHYRDDEFEMFPPDSISSGAIRDIVPEPNGTVLAATPKGLLVQRLAARRLLNSNHGLPCEAFRAVLRDARRAVWLSGSCGLIQISDAEFERWLADPDSQVQSRLFDVADGVQAGVGSFTPHARAGPDGRLWFATARVAQVIDSATVGVRHAAPPVLIESVTADRTVLYPDKTLTLPARTRDIEIQYTALSFIVPQKIKFQYRLEGRDQTWQDADTRRQAFYTDLPPGNYRFRVKACNSDGVWNDVGASIDFTISPTFFQTGWFIVLCVLGAAVATWMMIRIRVRQVAARIRVRFEERMTERERIARELHDTLLQSTQGLIFRVQAATNDVSPDDPARMKLEQALEHADEIMAEGRDRIQDLRLAEDTNSDLPSSLGAVGEELAKGHAADFRIIVEGSARALNPNVRDEAYHIGREALLNAFRHAQAKTIDVHIIYAEEELRVRVRDDGVGIDTSEEAGARPGHWGLKGMRERTQKIGTQLDVLSSPGTGTEIQLSVPAAIAYKQHTMASRWLSIRLFTGRRS